MKKLIFLIISLIILLLSCSSKNVIYKHLVGQWSIDEITYLKKSYKDQLYSNVLIFNEENNISIPETAHFKKDRTASWELIEDTINNKFLVSIKSKTTVFNDTFTVNFIEDKENKLRGVALKSDTIYIKAFKLLQNYNKW